MKNKDNNYRELCEGCIVCVNSDIRYEWEINCKLNDSQVNPNGMCDKFVYDIEMVEAIKKLTDGG